MIRWSQAQQRIIQVVVCHLLSVFIEVQSLAENSGGTKMRKTLVSVSTSSQRWLGLLETSEVPAQFPSFYVLNFIWYANNVQYLYNSELKKRKKISPTVSSHPQIKLFSVFCVPFHFLPTWTWIMTFLQYYTNVFPHCCTVVLLIKCMFCVLSLLFTIRYLGFHISAIIEL